MVCAISASIDICHKCSLWPLHQELRSEFMNLLNQGPSLDSMEVCHTANMSGLVSLAPLSYPSVYTSHYSLCVAPLLRMYAV